MVRRAPDRFGRDVFWHYLRARPPSLHEFIADLADEEGLDESNRQAWNAARNRILDWILDPSNAGRFEEVFGLSQDMPSVEGTLMEEIAKDDFLSLAKRVMLRKTFDRNITLEEVIRTAGMYGSLGVLRFALTIPRGRDFVEDYDYHSILVSVAGSRQPGATQILLEDGRFDPSWNDSSVILETVFYRDAPTLRLLLNDGRANPVHRNALEVTLRRGYAEMAELLLSDNRVRASVSKETALYYLDLYSGDMNENTRQVLENYIREIQRGQSLDDSEPPSKMIKDPLWN
jgi:hypothetical protein